MNPGAVLQAMLDEKGMTHVRLARELGVAPQTIDHRCKRDTTVTVRTLIDTYGAMGYRIVAVPIDGDGPSYELSGE